MRNLIRRLLPKQTQAPVALCQQHNSNKNPILAHEHCTYCKLDVCYMCSQKHISRGCQVKLPEFINQPSPYPPGDLLDKLVKFNQGVMVELNLKNLECLCGKKLDRSAAMCAACGLASCSSKCHTQWENAGNCTFNKNFIKIAEGNNMRSILFNDIFGLRKLGRRPGSRTNRSSQNMISSYLSHDPATVLLQRGFRIYGFPNESVLNNMTVLPKQLDFYMHLQRACSCTCQVCLNSGHHSVDNCVKLCFGPRAKTLNELAEVEMYEYLCECKCEHCSSGLISKSHLRINCSPQCKKSTEKM